MAFARSILIAVLVVALAAYAFDCGAMTTSEQAMECCASMPCAPHGHDGQDCCKSMPSMHAPFVQPSPVHIAAHALAAVATLTVLATASPALAESEAFTSRSHAPPLIIPPAFSPLRI